MSEEALCDCGGFRLQKEFGFVILSVVWMGFQLIFQAFTNVSPNRKKYFTQEFLMKHFGEEHKAMTGQEFPKYCLGYPDTGSGLYSHRLPYEQWYKLNVAFRIHMNYVEMVASIMALTIGVGIYFPITASIIAVIYMVGRQFYCIGYNRGGALNSLRLIGAITGEIILILDFILANVGITLWLIENYTR